MVRFVVRSSGERTSSLCEMRLRAVHPDAVVEVVSINPLAASLDYTLRECVTGADWLVVCDADVIPSVGGLRSALRVASSLPAEYFALTPRTACYLFSRPRRAGVRIYRTSFAPQAIEILQSTAADIRPESTMIASLDHLGIRSAQTDLIVGVHDRYQYHADLYRKGYFFADKHLSRAGDLLPIWKERMSAEADIVTAWLGFVDGLNGPKAGADIASFNPGEVVQRLAEHGIEEKESLDAERTAEVLGECDRFIESFRNPAARSDDLWRSSRRPESLSAVVRECRLNGSGLQGVMGHYRKSGLRSLVMEVRAHSGSRS